MTRILSAFCIVFALLAAPAAADDPRCGERPSVADAGLAELVGAAARTAYSGPLADAPQAAVSFLLGVGLTEENVEGLASLYIFEACQTLLSEGLDVNAREKALAPLVAAIRKDIVDRIFQPMSAARGEPIVGAAPESGSAGDEAPPEEARPPSAPGETGQRRAMRKFAAPPASAANEPTAEEKPEEEEEEADPASDGLSAAKPQPVSEECLALGVTENCFDINAIMAGLKEAAVEFNAPKLLFQGRKTEIVAVLRSDSIGRTPDAVSEELKGAEGDAKRVETKITQFMSARLSGKDFDIRETGDAKRLVTISQPVVWRWEVTPRETGERKVLRLELFAHIQQGDRELPAAPVKTVNEEITVDVKTWDWIVDQARAIEPIYGILATLIGILMALSTYVYRRSRRAAEAVPESATVETPRGRYIEARPSEPQPVAAAPHRDQGATERRDPAPSSSGATTRRQPDSPPSSLAHKPWFPLPRKDGDGAGES